MKTLKFRGDRVRGLRESMGWSQDDLAQVVAKATGKSPNQSKMSQWEGGRRNPSFEELGVLADCLQTTINYLLGDTDNSDPHKNGPSLVFVRGGNLRDAELIQAIIDVVLRMPYERRGPAKEILTSFVTLPEADREAMLSSIAYSIKLETREKQLIAHLARRLVEVELPKIKTNEAEEVARIVDSMTTDERPKALLAMRRLANNLHYQMIDAEATIAYLLEIISNAPDDATMRGWLETQIRKLGVTPDDFLAGSKQ